tara:strand:- start:902 stop:1051 length:150 start_codon:yes stop_codon:yes gene_type:complete
MSKETYQEIKRISGEELKNILSDLDNIFDTQFESLVLDPLEAGTCYCYQ